MVKCKLLVQNRDILKKEFQWASTNMIPFCGYYFAQRGKKVDAVRMKECKQLIKKNAAVFTKVKGDDVYPLAAMLALEENVNKALEERIRIYKTVCSRYQPSIWLTMVSFILADQAKQQSIAMDELLDRAVSLEETLKKSRNIKEEERSLCILLALSKKEETALTEDLKACYQMLEETALQEQARALLSLILALGEGEPKEKVHRLRETVAVLKNRQLRIGTNIEAVALGLIATSKGDPSAYIEDISEIDRYLKSQKGFDSLQLAAHERLMYAILFAMAEEKQRISQMITMVAMFYSVITLTVLE